MPPKRVKDDDDCGEPSPRISFNDLEKSMTPFSGDDAYGIETFVKDFEDISSLMQWGEIEKLIFSKRLLAGTAKLFLRSLSGTTTWDTLKSELREEFGKKLNSATVHKRLSTRRMKMNETHQQYFLHMKELAVLGNVEDEALMEYVIDGIKDSESNKNILYGACNIKEFRKKLDIYSEIKKKSYSPNKIQSNSVSKSIGMKIQKTLRVKRCFNCGDLDHESPNCTKGIKCFKCNLFGHKSTECSKSIKKSLEIMSTKNNIDVRPFKKLKINNIDVEALIDTGSDANLIIMSYFRKIQGEKLLSYSSGTTETLTGIAEKEIYTKGSFTAKIEIDDCYFETLFYVVDDGAIPVNIILGNPVLKEVEINFKSGTITATRILHLTMLENENEDITNIENKEYKNKIQNIIKEYNPKRCTKASNVKLKILLTDDVPVYQNPRRLSPLELNIVDKQIKEWLDEGIIKTKGEIKPSVKKIAAVEHFQTPHNIKSLQSFLGLTGYFRKFIKDYSLIAKPLTDLLKKVLKIYDPNLETELHTDASAEGYGAVLLQRSLTDNKMHPVYYMSKKTSATEKKYHSYYLEILAIVEAVKKFRVYLLGIKFKIVTDCSALTMTLQKKDLPPRVARWALLLEEYDYTIEHRPAARMKHADALSRQPIKNIIVLTDTAARLRRAQDDDLQIKLIKKVLEKESYDDYVLENGMLWKIKDGNKLMVVPKKMQNEIIRKHHENGHFGCVKTEELINRNYYMENLKEKIKTNIDNCVECILNSNKRGKKEGFLHVIDKGDLPLSTYHIDHLRLLTHLGQMILQDDRVGIG
ncbi:uncharacterized protein LOC123697879 isoform X2 [Colias croceus]|uniref:uncharacterized protein LOC123697879 isoform X2 n=1 Tax=Colias crocea TaxID=72248 RepID=UPI001E27E346|nr:uncharacterized protein LOC123697879 isoform X2 [Colias croceus]